MTEEFSRFVTAGAIGGGVITGAVIGGGAVAVGAGLGALGIAGATAGAFFWPVALPVVGIGLFIGFINETGDIASVKEQIEGVGLFNLAKLSASEMEDAKLEAQRIMTEIERNIKEKQEKLDNPAP